MQSAESMNDIEWKPVTLVVDENEQHRMRLVSHLRDSNLNVVEAASVDELLIQVDSVQPNLIVLAENMKLLDGFQLCALLREHRAEYKLYIVLLLEEVSQFKRYKAQNVGADAVVEKRSETNKECCHVKIERLIRSLA